MLRFSQVEKSYQNKLVLTKVNYAFEQQRYCIVGGNGSGKTTLLMLAGGLEEPNAGEVTYHHQAVTAPASKKHLGISSDRIVLPEFLTARRLLEFHCAQHACDFPDNLIALLNFTEQLGVKISTLSLGNLKKISLLLALAHQPQCLLLDEPTTGLDHDSRTWLLNYLAQYSGQVIVTSHEDCFIKDSAYTQLDITEITGIV